MILFIIGRRGLDHYIGHLRLCDDFQRPAAGKLLHAAHAVRTHNHQRCLSVIDKFRNLFEDGTPGNMSLDLYAKPALNIIPPVFHGSLLGLHPSVAGDFLNNMQQADFISRHKRNLDGMLQCIFSHRGEIPWHHNDLAVDFHNINVYS